MVVVVCLKCWWVCSPVHADCCYKLRCNELITSTGCGLWAPDHCELSWGVLAAPVLSSTCFNIYSLYISFDIHKIDKPGSSDGVPSSPPTARGPEDGETGGNLHGGLERISFWCIYVGTSTKSAEYFKLCAHTQTRALSPLWPMQEKDRTGCGSIHLDQVAEIFRMYEVRVNAGRTGTRYIENHDKHLPTSC